MKFRLDWAKCALICMSLGLAVTHGALADTSAPTAGTSDTTMSPVTINSCGPVINKNSSSQQQSIAGIPVPIPASTSQGIAIEFVNESKQTATLVNFAVDSAGERFVIRDVGTFSPGVSIKHQYRNGAGQAFVLPAFIAPDIKCHVASVKFADGTVWRHGQPQASVTAGSGGTSAPLTVSPASLTLEGAADAQLFLVSSSARVAAFKESDNCGKVASIYVVATADASATYSVKPIAAGTCSARVTDEAGNAITVPISVSPTAPGG